MSLKMAGAGGTRQLEPLAGATKVSLLSHRAKELQNRMEVCSSRCNQGATTLSPECAAEAPRKKKKKLVRGEGSIFTYRSDWVQVSRGSRVEIMKIELKKSRKGEGRG